MMRGLPRPSSPASLARLYANLALPQKTVDLLHRYFDAAVNFYGIAPLRQVLAIFLRDHPGAVSEEDFASFCDIVRRESQRYYVMGAQELGYRGGAQLGLDRCLIQEDLVDNPEDFEDLFIYQYGKPFYVPDRRCFLRYEDREYYEQSAYTKAMMDFLVKELKLSKDQAEDCFYNIYFYAQDQEPSIRTVLASFQWYDLPLPNTEQRFRFAELYVDLYNHLRMPCNRGYTPLEMAEIAKREENPEAASMSYGPGAGAPMLKESIRPDGRGGVAMLDFDESLTLIPVLPTPQRRQVTKVGRNEPCPCGSGKKYKKCCGR